MLSWLKNLKGSAHHSLLVNILIFSAMFLIFIQLCWWLIFFQINRLENKTTLDHLDRSLIKLAELGYSDPIVLFEAGRYRIHPAVIEERQRKSHRQTIMLISETIFLVLVLAYIHYRFSRIVKREVDLARERTAFLHSVTHDLKTPLATISLNLETLLAHRLKDTEKKSLLLDSMQAARHLEMEINNLLTGSALLRKNAPVIRGSTNINLALRNSLQKIKSLADSQNIALEFKEGPDLFTDNLEQSFFERALGNLLLNAIQYSDKGSTVILSLEKKKSRAVIQVIDKGQGLVQEELRNIFRPLFRGKQARQSGSGMGLSIARNIIQQGGGSLEASSPGQGHGSVFKISIPAKDNRT